MRYLWSFVEKDVVPVEISLGSTIVSREEVYSGKVVFNQNDILIIFGLNPIQFDQIDFSVCPSSVVFIADHSVGLKCIEKKVSYLNLSLIHI